MKSDFLIAITQLAAERNLPREVVLSAIEAALASAYKKDNAAPHNVKVRIVPGTGDMKVYIAKTVVDNIDDPQLQISLADARQIKKDVQLGDTVEIESSPLLAGRIAAQTAKQVVTQRLREAEREMVYAEFSAKEGDIVNGVMQRIEPKQIVVDLGRVEAVLPSQEQVPTERYRVGQRLRFYVLEVSRSAKGPQIILSRSHKNLLRRLFELEVPEIFNGTVEMKAVAREPGFRSKVAVFARQEGVDPVGSCVGMRGIRIQNIVNELQGEKIDVLPWHKDTPILIANSLSPAQVLKVDVAPEDGKATVVVPDRQLSLAIGKEGQNARLAARLTGWKIDIKSASEAEAERLQRAAVAAAAAPPPAPETAVQVPEPQPEAVASAVVEVASPVPEKEVAEVASVEPPKEVAALAPVELEEKVSVVQESKPPVEEAAISLEEAFASLERAAAAPKIRFAEEILGARGGKPKAKAKKGKAREETEGVRVKSTKRGQPVEFEEELEDL